MRLFVAVELPAEIRDMLGSLIDSLRARLDGPRWVRPEGIHLTLRFLGEVAPHDVSRLAGQLGRVVPGALAPFDVSVGGLGTFPESGKPRVLWIGVGTRSQSAAGDEALAKLDSLRRKVEEAVTLASLPGVAAETRPFHPHLTLARWGDARPTAGSRAVLEEFGAIERGRFRVSAVALIQSITATDGARYHRIEEFPL